MSASMPAWVPALFVALVVLGYRQALPRTVKPGALVALALAMLGLSFYGLVGTFGSEPLALLAWAAGYAASVSLGTRRFSVGLSPLGSSVRVPGNWVPMVLLLGIFVAKFALGFATAVHSPLLHQTFFVVAASAALGVLSGGFGARAVAVLRCATAARVA